ncbi:MAG: DUF4065 domain-containing protein [Candidatus Margulisbacteria bacterium]|nr:DUF4065 domain-containing protein [Candidatus Margulisiibacteriota bacterium]
MATLKQDDVAKNIARYFLYRCNDDGELITPLKMQKLVYYAYVWTLINNRKPIINEKFEAWPNGPVLPSLYNILKKYGSSPIDGEFLNLSNEKDLSKLRESLGEIIPILDEVYEKYATKSAFELVTITHNEKPWKNARKGLDATQPSKNPLLDKDILEEYEQKR